MMYGLSEYQMAKLPKQAFSFLSSIWNCKDKYPVVQLPDYSLVYSACCVGGKWVVITDCNVAFNLSGFTFYPHLCDSRPEMAKAMAKVVCLLFNLDRRLKYG